ncbi:MAG: hypothetical protein ABIO76_03940, partial [Ginsengibacter sp.]
MKKFLAAILAVLYFTVTTGATIQMHFCMGKFIGKDILNTSKKKCGNCGMQKNNAIKSGCCKDEHKFYKFDNDQKITEASFQFLKLSPEAIPSSRFEFAAIRGSSLSEEYPTSNAPPGLAGIAIYKR